MAGQYIISRFKNLGLEPKGTDGYLQTFDFKFKPNPHEAASEGRKGRNIVGYLDNGAKNTVVIGGHYDHLGIGRFGSRHLGEPQIHNGADDNASGIASILLLAKALKASELKNNNYLFIAFSGEELGLYGSKYYVNNPTVPLESINYMINLDMIGRLNAGKVLAINGAGTSPAWKEIFGKLDVRGIKVKTTDSGIGPSDHTSFYLQDIPAIHYFSGQHEDYHKPEDDSERVNYDGIYEISEHIYAVISALDSVEKIEFTKTKDDNVGRTASKFKVTLGVMPDYVYEGTGMRVDGVLSDRSAEVAGMEKGDIIIKIGDVKVKDIYDYMDGLAKFKKGDKTMVVVKRKDKEVKLKVVF
jgi:Zn-dependent M28 family amino/carboxypeptidase